MEKNQNGRFRLFTGDILYGHIKFILLKCLFVLADGKVKQIDYAATPC